jgi:7-cyano-7-deazaguanine synthase
MKVMVLVSGGLDSTVLLAHACNTYGPENVFACSIQYGQKHSKELMYARFQAQKYKVPMIELDLSPIFAFNKDISALMQGSGKDIEHKSYAEQLADLGGEGTVSAYVPFRNGLFLSCAASIALQLECGIVAYGAHKDDACGRAYPDCTSEFIESFGDAIDHGSGGKLCLVAPFAESNKAGIVALGVKLGVDFAHTWSCYEGGEEPCGTCGTCIDRKAALEANGIYDIK